MRQENLQVVGNKYKFEGFTISGVGGQSVELLKGCSVPARQGAVDLLREHMVVPR
jgi:hypothetical protein